MSENNNTSEFGKGLNLDSSPLVQPKGTYRFALNTVNETENGDSNFRSNEGSNSPCASLTPGYIPICKIPIGKNQVIILSVSEDDSISEIGIMDDNCNYTVHVNDETSPEKEKLNFKVARQIQGSFRLRKGCERTIYFAGKGYPVRYYNFDKPNQFKKNGYWAASKFRLTKRIERFPTIDKVEVLDNEGSVLPGSYSILVQHIDEDLNGTEYYELVKNIRIYNDPLDKNFSDIEGSSNIGEPGEPFKYTETSKAISIVLDSVDEGFSYIRFAIVERTSGNGQISGVKYSDIISVNNPMFVYTGKNATTNGTIEEVELFNLNAGLDSAEHIEQIDNMLILANVMGEQADICKLQKYASKIKTDCFVKDIILTSVKEDHNPKNPLVDYNGIGYQPGDVYSSAIMWVFEDYSLSPPCHIPGKSPDVPKTLVYSPGPNVYPMSNINNTNSSERYLDENSSCASNNFWGVDSEGVDLKNKRVRHHRFPTRDEIGVGFVKRIATTDKSALYKKIQLNVLGDLKPSDETYTAPNFTIKVTYKKNGVNYSFSDAVYPTIGTVPIMLESNLMKESDTVTDIKLFYQEEGELEVEIPIFNNKTTVQPNGLEYKINIQQIKENEVSHIYEVPIFGLKFSNIELPPEEEIGKKVIGYQIVRQERTEADKNILDTAVVFPMMKSGRNVSTAMLAPEFWTGRSMKETTCEGAVENIYPTCYNISKNNVMLVSPSHKFLDKTHDGFTTIEEVGKFKREYTARSAFMVQNIYDGTSATGDEDKATRDDDGFSLKHVHRFVGVDYVPSSGEKFSSDNHNTRMYNLQALSYADTEDGTETLYNLACDNKALVLSSVKPGVNLRTYRPNKHEYPYVYIKKENSSFYQSFRNNPYYYADTRVFTEDTCEVFGGDTYVAPLRYSNHIFGNVSPAMRRKKVSIWIIITSIVVAIVGVVLAIFTGGTSVIGASAIIMALGAVATGVAALVEAKKFSEIYADKWEANLDRTVFDYFYAASFIREDPYKKTSDKDWEISEFYQAWEDDTFKWFGDIVGDLWFETPINISLRVPPVTLETNYLRPLKNYMTKHDDRWKSLSWEGGIAWVPTNIPLSSGGFHRYIDCRDEWVKPQTEFDWYFAKKIAKVDAGRSSGLLYQGISTPQVYLVNPDHHVNIGIKKFYTIPTEYDCCSECRECYPHRIHYSLQSFQEEKSDNYRMFLPNNYRDIEGETGVITNIFRLYNNLFVHTEEALWQMGRNYQERVTGDVISFIGTGSYFEIPPQKVVDGENGYSAGSTHKWSTIKTPAGIFFVSEKQGKIFQFDGKKIEAVTEKGMSHWFKNNTTVLSDQQYLEKMNKPYPFRDNPSNIVGSGFLSVYDSKKERVIFTKRDMSFKENLFTNNSEFCINGNTITVFDNLASVINVYTTQGYVYHGKVDCRLKFVKTITTTDIVTNTSQIWHEPVYETITIEGGAFLNQVCVTGRCDDIKSCDVIASITDVDGNTYTESQTVSPNDFWTMCINVGAFVDDDMHTLIVNGQTGYPYQADFNYTETRTETVLVQEGYWETKIEETPVQNTTEEVIYVDGTEHSLEDYIEYDNSWTISYSLKEQSWVSWHSYIPNFYINVPEKFYSWKHGSDLMWKHNEVGNYFTYYGHKYSFIIDYVSNSPGLNTMTWEYINFIVEAKKYNPTMKEFYTTDTFFNKGIFYNSKQCSGLMNIIHKDNDSSDYFYNQTNNMAIDEVIADRNEKHWSINELRDIRVNYEQPIWNSGLTVQGSGYIDKVLNSSSLDYNKDWSQMESFRDKYLSVRLIFDKFADVKLIMNFSNENENPSIR